MGFLYGQARFHLDLQCDSSDLLFAVASGDRHRRVENSVMFTMAHGLRGQTTTEGLVPAKAVRLAALLGVLVLTSVAVNALVIHADRDPPRQSSNPADCSAIGEAAARLACYDALAGRPVRQPFKGANVPAVSLSR
jgi:hypothetical protein